MLEPDSNSGDYSDCKVCIDNPTGSECESVVAVYKAARDKDQVEVEEQNVEGSLDTCSMSLTTSGASDFSYKGNGTVPSKFTAETLKIVERHLYDFNYTNYHSYVNSQGGLKSYMKKLGGVFGRAYGKKYTGKKESEIIEVSEYVFGIMQMYGFDYFSGKTRKYCKWGGSCMYYEDLNKAIAENKLDEFQFPSGSSDAFYPGEYRYEDYGLSNSTNFDALLAGNNMTTNCNWTVDMVYFKAGIFNSKNGFSGAGFSRMAKRGKVIERICDIRIGDVMHFFETSVDPTNPNTWSGWGHVAYIGEIDGKTNTVTVYDGGSYLTNNRNFKWTFKIDPKNSNKMPDRIGGYAGYGIVRPVELEVG
jgi:hypothetical protein